MNNMNDMNNILMNNSAYTYTRSLSLTDTHTYSHAHIHTHAHTHTAIRTPSTHTPKVLFSKVCLQQLSLLHEVMYALLSLLE